MATALEIDFSINRGSDSTVAVSMVPPVPISGWTIEFTYFKRFGSVSPIYSAGIASGIPNGASGLTITDFGNGVFNVLMPSSATSSGDLGLYCYSVDRLDSGFVTSLVIGQIQLLPS